MPPKRKRGALAPKSKATKRANRTELKSKLMAKLSELSAEEIRMEWKRINSIRCLSAAQPQHANSGHPGAPMALAPLAYGLWSYVLKFSPSNPNWWNRDRFLLSNGHACALQYSMLHLLGYNVTLDDLKQFRQINSVTPGHPEARQTEGVETSTGPLGQGISNGIGMALAAAHIVAEYNKDDIELFDPHIFVICGDGCLQEGIASEACSLAGHLGLGRLIVVYDSNHITIDGDTKLSFTEDVAARFLAYNWHVQTLPEPLDNDYQSVIEALENAKAEATKPSLIIARTTIAYGSLNQGHHKTHGAPLGEDDVKQLRRKLKILDDPSLEDDDKIDLFRLDSDVLQYFSGVGRQGDEVERQWREEVWGKYQTKYPKEAKELERRFSGQLPKNWESVLPRYSASDKGKATRGFSGIVLNNLVKIIPEIVGGSADLTESNKTALEGHEEFSAHLPSGRYIRFGVREHAMTAMTTGIFSFGCFRPFSATFLNFVMYGWGAMRLAALTGVGTLMIASHDSIELGEDGPTHQPVEVIPLLRSTPALIPIRPADGNETSGAYAVWLKTIDRPTMILLCRSEVPNLEGSSVENVAKGAYVLTDFENNGGKRIILASSGSELHMVVAARNEILGKHLKGIDVRIVSMPSWNLYAEQPEEYRMSVLPTVVSREGAEGGKIDGALYVEAATKFGWDRYFDVDESIGMIGFGASANRMKNWEKFGFTVENIVQQTEKLLCRIA